MLIEAHPGMDKFQDATNKMANLLSLIKAIDVNVLDIDEIDTTLFDLHFKVSSIGRCLEGNKEMIEVIMGRYRKLVREREYAKD